MAWRRVGMSAAILALHGHRVERMARQALCNAVRRRRSDGGWARP